MSAHTQAKARRLIAGDRVRRSVVRPPYVFRVQGDSGDWYMVVVGAGIAMCSCEGWRKNMRDCSHIEAARLSTPEGQADALEASR
jgi:hypothetical protein